MIKVVLTLLAGGVATSFAEYHFKYNLFDYILDGVKKIKGLFSKSSK
jgi:hypothetical protein